MIIALLVVSWNYGFQKRIEIYEDEVQIVKKWFLIPFKKHEAKYLKDVFDNGDWSLEEGATSLILKLDDGEEFDE